MIMCLGEIDCREGLLRAVERCKYEVRRSKVKYEERSKVKYEDGRSNIKYEERSDQV